MTTPLQRYEYYAQRSERVRRAHTRRLLINVGVFVLLAVLFLARFWSAAPPVEADASPNAQSDADTPPNSQNIEDTVYYRDCAAARAAGAAPIYAGEPGYREGMDGDDDGIACEWHP